MKYHGPGGLNNNTVLEAGKSEIKAPADLVSGKALFPGSQMTLLTVLT